MKIVFFGTPEFSAATLDFLIQSGIEVCGVISRPDKPKGRSREPVPTPVKELIQSKYPHIPLWQPEKVSDLLFAPTLEMLAADFFVVVAYGEIIKEHLLVMPKIACINVHTSLLPKWRGAAPIQRAVMQGDKQSGVTVMYMVKKMDAGDMISQTQVEIHAEMTFGELEEALLETGKKDLLLALELLQAGTANKIAQNIELVTFAPKVELEECEVKWNKPASELHDLIRGTNPEPGSWCWVTLKNEKKRLKIFKSKLSPLKGKPGEVLSWGKTGWIIGCGEGGLELLEIQLEGKKRTFAKDFMLGFSPQAVNFNY